MDKYYAVDLMNGCMDPLINGTLQGGADHSLNCNNVVLAWNIGSYHSNAWKSDNPESGIYEADVAKTLDCVSCGYPACNQGGR